VKILLLPCEVSVKTVLPAIKALMARDIVENHGLKEKQVAEILGLSQSAISRYKTKDRGNIIILENEPEVRKLISQMTTFLVYEPQKKKQILELFCATCETIRKKGLMCELCKQKMHKKWAETCTFCNSI
jgi:predicted transcriptional regulator